MTTPLPVRSVPSTDAVNASSATSTRMRDDGVERALRSNATSPLFGCSSEGNAQCVCSAMRAEVASDRVQADRCYARPARARSLGHRRGPNRSPRYNRARPAEHVDVHARRTICIVALLALLLAIAMPIACAQVAAVRRRSAQRPTRGFSPRPSAGDVADNPASRSAGAASIGRDAHGANAAPCRRVPRSSATRCARSLQDRRRIRTHWSAIDTTSSRSPRSPTTCRRSKPRLRSARSAANITSRYDGTALIAAAHLATTTSCAR